MLDDIAASASSAGFGTAVDFEVISASQIADIRTGAGILPYRVVVNGTYRHPRGNHTPEGNERLPKLPVDLHFLVVVAAVNQATKLSLVGWVMRTLEDHPVIPVGLLNRDVDAFDLDEVVEIAFDDVPHEELLHLWEATTSQPSFDALAVPYVARSINIESVLDQQSYSEVQERLHRYGVLSEVSG
jgi:hypothetical protein